MNCIDNAVVGDYKTLSFLFYLTRNMDIFLLIFQPSEFLSIYTIVITRLLPCFRPRFSALSLFLLVIFTVFLQSHFTAVQQVAQSSDAT